jgi:antitoxin component YwqK of YwqJK toxin-antitoxin module
MRLIILIITLITFINISSSWGQAPDTLYLDSLYTEVAAKLNAKYVRIIASYNSAIKRFQAFDLDKSGQRVFEGHLRFVNSNFPDGEYLYYFDNGAMRLKGRNRNVFDKDFEFEEELWHPNGIRQGNTSFKNQYHLHNHYDTVGRQEVKDGNGRCDFISYFDKSIHRGAVSNGKKNGVWLIFDFKGTIIARETYKEGKLIIGYKITKNLDSIPYRHFGLGGDGRITDRIEREIKKQVKEQLSETLNLKKEIFYSIHVKGNEIINVQLLRDKFIIDNRIKLNPITVNREYIVTEQGEPVDETVLVLKFKMKV